MDIPVQFRWKLGCCDIEFVINKHHFQAVIADPDDVALMEKCTSELKARVQASMPVVGVSFQISTDGRDRLLTMYAGELVLYTELNNSAPLPRILGDFLSDKSICFVGFEIDVYLNDMRRLEEVVREPRDCCLTGKGAEIRDLAAAVYGDDSILECGSLEEVARKMGCNWPEICAEDVIMGSAHCKAKVFGETEIKCAMIAAYSSFYLGRIALVELSSS